MATNNTGLSWLFGSTPPAAWTAPATATTTMPAWYQAAEQGLISNAAAAANEPYNPFPGPQVAGLNPLQSQAISSAYTVGQPATNTMNSAIGTTQAGATMFDPNQFNQFMSPYTSGVVNTIADLGARNLSENLLPQVNDTFIGSGMPFGSRHADFTARAVRDANESILNQQSQALESGFQNAMGNYQGALGREVNAGNTLGGLSNIQNTNALNTLGAQNQLGGVAQQNAQQNIDAAVQNFQQQQNWPVRGLDIVNAILKGYSPGSTLTAYDSTPQTTNNSSVAGGTVAALQSLLGGPTG